MDNYVAPSLFADDSVATQQNLGQPCRRCAGRAVRSRRAFVKALFESERDRVFTLREISRLAEAAGKFCPRCTPENTLSLQIYHLRQDGITEKVGVSRFRYRKSDATTPDFIYARRARKE